MSSDHAYACTRVVVLTTPWSMTFCAISSQSMNLMAPFGHCSAQRPHEMHFVDTPVSLSTRGMFHGHAWLHMPQPMHFFVSTVRAPDSSSA